MERIWLGVFCLSAWSISTCLLRQYHYVHEYKTWTEAQSYCRRHYTDLATIEDSSEMDQLINSVSDENVSEVWLGLFSEVDWRWSDGYTEKESGYTNWNLPAEPNFKAADQLCVLSQREFGWGDYFCESRYPFICYSGTQFVYINQELNWTDAQSYCRSNYIDLATVKNPSDEEMIHSVIPYGNQAWIGSFRNPNFNWSDGSSFSFTHWYGGNNPLWLLKTICGVASMKYSGEWRFLPCDLGRRFVCQYTSMKKQTVKLRMKVDSSVDLNDPVIRADILKKFHDKLNMARVSGVTLKWQEQSDSDVFHKET